MYPDRPAIRLDDVVLTYAGLDDLSARLETLPRFRGLEIGDRVGIMLPNMPEFATKDHFEPLRCGSVARLSGRIHRRRMWPRQFGGMS